MVPVDETAAERDQDAVPAIPLPRTEAGPWISDTPGHYSAVRTASERGWRSRYVASIVVGDAVCALLAGLVGLLVRFGDPTDQSLHDGALQAAAFVAVMPLVWVAGMFASRSYEQRFLWVGAEEFRRVLSAGVWVVAGFGTFSWAIKWDIARGFVVVALPLAAIATLLERYGRRQLLHRRRRRGQYLRPTLIVGHRSGVAGLRKQVATSRHHGLAVVGCCLPAQDGVLETAFDGVPVLGTLDDVLDVVRRHGVETVAVLPSPELEGPALRRLGWELERTAAELLLAPAVTEVAGPRVAIRPVAGLPLLHVERPEFTGARRLAKAGFDIAAAATALVILAPVLLTIAALIRLTGRGPVFYRQQRVGKDGRTFSMLKFRSMVVDADQMLADLRGGGDGNGVLFKLRDDPRVTGVGRVLRRYSIDELPQLINVVSGQMSLVGPRPPLPSETLQYGFDMRRRFLVKPGMTGLWQVSGRSDLSWEDSVRLDLRYVENWSFGMDLFILWKTLGAVRGARGAY